LKKVRAVNDGFDVDPYDFYKVGTKKCENFLSPAKRAAFPDCHARDVPQGIGMVCPALLNWMKICLVLGK